MDKIFCHLRKNIFPQKKSRFLLVNMYKPLFVNGQKTQKKNSDFFIEMREKSKLKTTRLKFSSDRLYLTLLFKIGVTIQNSIRKTAVSQRSLPHVVTSPYKIAFLFECKHSQKAILHGSE